MDTPHFQQQRKPGSRWVLFGLCLTLLLSPFGLSAQDTTPDTGDDVIGTLVMVDESTQAVLDLLEKLTGKIILRPQNIQPQKINFDSRGPLTREQAIMALESLLSMNGLAIVPVDETFDRAVQSSIPVNPLTPDLISEEDLDAPPSQKLFSKIYTFGFLTIDQVLEILPNFTTPNVPVAVPLRKSNSVMVTDALSNLQRLEDIFEQLDQPKQFDGLALFIPLEHINAKELETQFSELAQETLSPYLGGNTTFGSDERSNQLIVFTHPSNEGLIRDLVDRFDIDVAPFTGSEVFYLKHAQALDVGSLIEQVISGQQSAQDSNESQAARNRRTQQQQNQQAQQAQQPVVRITNTGGESGGPTLQFSDYVGIVADERSNAIVAYGTASDIKYIEDLINKMDVLLAQVRIEVIVAEVTLGEEIDRGINAFSVNYNVDGVTPGGLDEIGVEVDGRAFDLTGTLEDFSLQSVFQTAQTNSDVDVLSSPSVVTTHNQEATINVSESRPVITSVQSDTTNVGSTRSSVQFRDIGIQLTVKPLIGSNGVIQMEIEQTVETVVSTTIIDGNEQPIIGKREATSFVSVSDQETVVLAGLQENSQNETYGRVALFGYIPVIGEFFRSKRVDNQIRELIIFIKPSIILDTEEASQLAEDYIDNSNSEQAIDRFRSEGMKIDERQRGDPGPTKDALFWMLKPFNDTEEAVEEGDAAADVSAPEKKDSSIGGPRR